MAARLYQIEYGVPDKVLQKDLVPDWSAAELTTGASIQHFCSDIISSFMALVRSLLIVSANVPILPSNACILALEIA